MKLVVIEAPAKRETLKKYLGSGFEVFATKGHIRDLPVKSYGIDMRDFEPKYEIMAEKKSLIEDLKKKAKQADEVYIATDPGREGEAISWHIAYILGYDKDKKCRIEFNEISQTAVQNALKQPRVIDQKLVDAQQARRVLDRIVGYKLSPIICKKIHPKISAGRVQSVALKLVVDREKEIESFKPEEYWNISAEFLKENVKFKAPLIQKNGKKIVPKNKEESDQILKELNDGAFVVKSIKKSNTKSHAPAPFTTSTMQQDALNKLGMSLKRTTQSAQELYEGVDVAGEGKIALITYIRTDSTRVSSEAQNKCLDFVKKEYGENFVPKKPNIYATKKNAQDAHEAIRPINMNIKPERVKESLSPDNYKLYKLIYERFLASQMTEALYSNVQANIDNGAYTFKATGKTLDFPGYTAVYKEYSEEAQEISRLPKLEEGDQLKSEKINCEQKFTKPPARYTEASLVKAMEELGIGRPATYAATITVLSARDYVHKDGKSLVPTDLGRKITEYLDKFFSSIINVKFTAHMESRLDDIATDGENWKGVVESFWNGFSGLLERAGADKTLIFKDPPKETDIVCPKCGHKMVIREGKYGKFLGCSNYPACKNIMPMQEEVKSVGICPDCGKEVYPRKSKAGKTFYSCSGYPDCKFMSWYPPTGEKCPKCNSFLVTRGKKIVCSNSECDYSKGKE